jgi:kynurenine aminotransferase
MRRPPSNRIAHFQQDVWSIFSPLAVYCKAVNLGQGFPNFETPEYVKEAACDAIRNGLNQYAPPKGLQSLRNALSLKFSSLFNRTLNADTEIMVSAGANEGIFSILQAFLNEGDEVICLEPFFDQYSSNITMSGGKIVYCPLKPSRKSYSSNIPASEWKLDMHELESKITKNSKVLLFNTPHNPIGKVFNQRELESIASLAIKHDLLVISDEVYEQLVYPGAEHKRIANIPGMWERTITVGSAGKTFCATGWRIGWLIGPADLIGSALLAHSRIVFTSNTPVQQAVACGFEQEPKHNYFSKQIDLHVQKRDFLVNVFNDIGLRVTIPGIYLLIFRRFIFYFGGYFHVGYSGR